MKRDLLAKAKSKRPAALRRTRYEPPTLEEAVLAAQGLADDVQGQVEIAATLMGLPEAEVRPAVLQARMIPSRVLSLPSSSMRSPSRSQAVVVERRRARVLSR
jgi:hypothetical protein